MNEEKRNRIIIVCVIVFLLISVIVAAILLKVATDKKENEFDVKFVQVYNGDYDLHFLNENMFFGTYDNKLNVFIDKDGKEVLKMDSLIDYDSYYKTKEGNYLFYSNKDNNLVAYVFDGKTFSLYYSIDNIGHVRPIISNNVIVGFASYVEDKLYLFSLENDGISVLYEETLVTDKIIDNVYYTNSNKYMIVSNKDGYYGAVNIKGEYIIKCEYKDLFSLSNDTFIFKNENNKYGIIDNLGNVLVKASYDGILPYEDYYLVVKGSKMALFDKEYNNLTKFRMNYNKLLDFDYRKDLSVKLFTVGDNVVVLNNHLEDYYKRDYKYHNMYVIKDGKIIDDINQRGFYSDKVIYSFDDDYEFKIYNTDMKVIEEFKLENSKKIEKINSVEYYNGENLLIRYSDEKKDYKKVFNYKGKIVKEDKKIVLSNSMYYLVEEDNKVVVYDLDNNNLTEAVGKINYIDNNFVVLDKILYRIVID